VLGLPALRTVADRHGATTAQVVLAWALRHEQLAVLPMMRTPAEVRENAEALGVRLAPDDLLAMDDAFPRPRAPEPIVVA
jgi:diketogulonate reductase-like aldo/keto reductase